MKLRAGKGKRDFLFSFLGYFNLNTAKTNTPLGVFGEGFTRLIGVCAFKINRLIK